MTPSDPLMIRDEGVGVGGSLGAPAQGPTGLSAYGSNRFEFVRLRRFDPIAQCVGSLQFSSSGRVLPKSLGADA